MCAVCHACCWWQNNSRAQSSFITLLTPPAHPSSIHSKPTNAQSLFTQTGVLNIGEPLVTPALAAAREHGLPHTLLDSNQLMARFPGGLGLLVCCTLPELWWLYC